MNEDTLVAASDMDDAFFVSIASEYYKHIVTLEQAFQNQAKVTCELRGYKHYEVIEFRPEFRNSLGRSHAPVRRGFAHGWVNCY